MVYTFEVLKPLKSREVNDVQPENISSMFCTFEVLILSKLTDVNDVQPENI